MFEKKNSPDADELSKNDEEEEKNFYKTTNKTRHIEDPDHVSMTKAKIETCKGDEELNDIECYLETDDLWKKFHELGTEMIITKSGRLKLEKINFFFLRIKI